MFTPLFVFFLQQGMLAAAGFIAQGKSLNFVRIDEVLCLLQWFIGR